MVLISKTRSPSHLERSFSFPPSTCIHTQVDAIDVSVDDPARNISAGVLMGEGDGTVTLMSLGFACNKVSKPRHERQSVLRLMGADDYCSVFCSSPFLSFSPFTAVEAKVS